LSAVTSKWLPKRKAGTIERSSTARTLTGGDNRGPAAHSAADAARVRRSPGCLNLRKLAMQGVLSVRAVEDRCPPAGGVPGHPRRRFPNCDEQMAPESAWSMPMAHEAMTRRPSTGRSFGLLDRSISR
jgi:hypothetical protein